MMFLPGKKVVCVGLINFWAMVDSLLVVTLVKILKDTFQKQIGLGKRIMVPKLR